MRLGILIRDTEYRNALVQKLSTYDNDIFVKIIENNVKDTSGCVILTDISPSELDRKVFDILKPRTVFITLSGEDIPDGCSSVFKFCSIPEMISELSLVYNRWHGKSRGIDHTARLIFVCCESDSYSAERCRALAGQIVYSHGGSVFILPLSYINDYGIPDARQNNSISRLLYSIQSGRDSRFDCVTYTDSYGISAMVLPPGSNPVAYLDEDELRTLIFGLSRHFDIIITDAGTCFRKENIALMKDADNVVFFERGRRNTGIAEMLGSEASERLIRLRITGGSEDAVSMDDCVRRIYGTENNESYKNGNNRKIRN